ncbi:MAG: MraY family glycosyltransferase [Candidatus Omnitrophota bacterium]
MLIKLILLFMAGFLANKSIIGLLKKISLKHNWNTSGGISLAGGPGIWLAFIITVIPAFFYTGIFQEEIAGVILASGLMFIFGYIDDRKELSVGIKFLVQIIATGLLVASGIKTRIAFIPEMANIIITFIWVVGITNAFNHLDVLDGVGGMIALVVSSAFCIIVSLQQNTGLLIIFFSLSAVICGFLTENLPPAKVYLGNSGSHFLGFILAALALVISYATLETKTALFTPLLIMGFPVFDTAFLILIRLKQKRSVFKKSNDHLALRFLKIGHSKSKTLITMTLLAIFFAICGIAVYRSTPLYGLATIIFAVLVTTVLIRKASRVEI